MGARSTGWLRDIPHNVYQAGRAAVASGQVIEQLTRQGLAVVLSALMIMIPVWQGEVFAQSAPTPGAAPAADGGQQVPQGQPLSVEQLDQLVAPIALYPDALVAQVLAAATYPTEVVEADRWRQAQGNAPAEQIAAGAEAHNWDPSVKALTAFPAVLAQMDRNLRWTTDLGNAYYNQPQDVMDSVQAMRQKAQAAGQLRSTPQQVVTNSDGEIVIAPANPAVVYVPVYNPWTVWGSPFPMYAGYYYAPPPGIFWGGLAIGFGIGIGIGLFAHWGWGWGHWGIGWHDRAVFYNHASYFTRSVTVVNRGLNRPGGPPRNFGARGAFARPAGEFNRPAGSGNRQIAGYRSAAGANRPGGAIHRPVTGSGRPGTAPRATAARASMNHGPGASPSSAHPGGSGHPGSGGHPSGAGHPKPGGHPSGGGHSGEHARA
jgi:hypothetical protein